MAEPLSILMLRRKSNRIRDIIARYEWKLKEAQSDLAHVNATLRLFAATGEPEDMPPYVDLNRVFRRGETTTICMNALEAEGPLNTRQLTRRVMLAKGLDTNDKVLFQTIALRVVQTLRVKAKRRQGIDGSLRHKGVCVWRLTSPNAAANIPSIAAIPDGVKHLERLQEIEPHLTRGGDLPAMPFLPHTRPSNEP